MSRRRIGTSLAAGSVVLAAGSQIAISTNVPEIWSPFPAATLILLLSGLSRMSVAVVVLLVYAGVSAVALRIMQATSSQKVFTIGQILLLLCLGSLHVIYLAATWREGVLRFGGSHMYFVASAGALLYAACCRAVILVVRSKSSLTELAAVTLTLFWLTTYAFPWTTELP
jgi:hypothetical protein